MFERSSPSYKKHVRKIGLRWRKTRLLHIFYFTFGEVLLSKRSFLLICWQSQIVMELFESNALENTKSVIWLSKHKKKTPVICSICLGVVLTIIYTDICGRYDKKKNILNILCKELAVRCLYLVPCLINKLIWNYARKQQHQNFWMNTLQKAVPHLPSLHLHTFQIIRLKLT